MSDVLNAKRALVTGATGGLGREIARALARRGARLFLSGRDETALEELIRELSASGRTADLMRVQDVEGLAEAARHALGGVDILVHSAGVFPVAPLAETSLETFDRCLAVNLRAAFLLARALAPEMAAQRWGRIVLVGSSSAYSGFRDTSVYCASKHGLLGFSRALHEELKGSNVRTFCVSPGSIKTPMARSTPDQDFETFLEPAEVAAFLVELISSDGEMIAQEVRLNRMVLR